MTEKKRKQFLCFLAVTDLMLLFYYLAERVNSYNATLLAFSYEYGFIPRGFLGTIYQMLHHFLPLNLQTYGAVNGFVLITTVIYAVFVFVFLRFLVNNVYKRQEKGEVVLSESQNREWDAIGSLMVFFLIFAVPTFAGYYNFGRVDMYLVLLSLLAIVLVMKEKGMWALVPMAAAGVMIHEGYVFMYLNIILVLLAYKGLSSLERKEKRTANRYLFLLLLVFCMASALFLYFVFFYQKGTNEVYEQIVETANAMSYRNKCHKDVIRAEILGVNLSKEEWKYHVQNFVELPIFVVLMSPFLSVVVKVFKKIFEKASSDRVAKTKYLLVAGGALTTLPLFLWKVDYGRWCFAVIAYYCLVMLALMAMGDSVVLAAWGESMEEIQKKWVFSRLLLGYALLMTPLCDVSICKFSYLIYSFPDKIGKMLG